MRFQFVARDGGSNSAPDEVQVLVHPVQRLQLASRLGAVLSEGGFSGQLRATPGERHVVQATTNFQSWLPLQTNTVDFLGLLQFIDAARANFPYRFYRSVQE